MAVEKCVMSLFDDETQAASAIEALRGYPWKLERVHSPIPSDKILNALKLKKSRVGYFTLAGGIIGLFSGVGLAIYTAMQWNLIVSGKPVVAWIPFLIVGFEFTILFAVFGNVLGLLLQTNLPEFKSLRIYDGTARRIDNENAVLHFLKLPPPDHVSSLIGEGNVH